MPTVFRIHLTKAKHLGICKFTANFFGDLL